MKSPRIVDVHGGERRLAADRRVAVGMRAVDQPQERAIGDGAGHVAHLRQAVQPQLPYAREIALAQRGADDHVRQDRERALGESAEDGDAGDRRVRSDVGVELRAEARQRLVHLDRRTIAAALVEHVGGDGSEPFLARRIRRGAAPDEQRERDERHTRMGHGPHAKTVGQRRLLDSWKRERPRRAGFRQTGPVDLRRPRRRRRSHETTAGSDPGAASATRPCGTTLSVTRPAGSRYRPTACVSDAAVTS